MKKLIFNKKDDNVEKHKINTKKVIGISIFILILVMLIVLGTLYERNRQVRRFFDKYVFMKNVYENNLSKIETDSSHIFAHKNNILIWKNNELKVYNKHGTEEASIYIELINPIYQTAGDYMCIADKDRGKVYVLLRKNIIWENELEGKISNVSINKDGYCAVTLLGTTDKSVVQVYNNKGEKLFSKHIAEDYVVDTAISSDNCYLSIAKVNCSGINIKSIIETISIKNIQKGETVINEYNSDLGELIVKIKYNNKNELICMYDTYISIVQGNKTTKEVDFKNENVLFADINNCIVKVVKNKQKLLNQKIEIQILDTEELKTNIYEIEEPKAIYVCDNIIAINFGSEAIFINNNGWLLKEYKSSQEINDIVISNDIAGIVYKNKVEIVSL